MYLFDTFSGMTKPTDVDRQRRDGKTAIEILGKSVASSPIWARASIEDVKAGMSETQYPQELIHYVRGSVEQTLSETSTGPIAILRLDTDWYESTRVELAELYPRIAPGGILIIDDYGSWEGSRQATDEYLHKLENPPFLTRIDEGRIAVKR